MKKRISVILGILAALVLVACGPSSLNDSIERECNGPYGKSVVALPGRKHSEGDENYLGTEVRITCQDGSTHIARVE